MSAPKHTPGPICTCGVITTVIETGIGCYDENEIAQCPLCKAAPAMYEALQAMLNGILFTRGASMSEDRWQTLTTIARTALAQAEGRG